MEAMDVAIIGAGPAGSVTAQRLAAKGFKVVLLEKDRFPRVKTCGDLVTREGLQALERTGLGEWMRAFKIITMLRFTSPDNQVLDIPVGSREDPLARIIQRRVLDEKLVRAGIGAGVDFREAVKVSAVEVHAGEGVVVRAKGLDLRVRMLILADGSHAPLTRSLGLIREAHPDLIAVRQYLAGDRDPEGALEFHFQQNVIPGYTWMFPLGDGLVNVGAGTYTRRTRNKEIDLRAVVEDFINHHPLESGRLRDMEPLGPIKGHPLHTNLKVTRTHADHTLVVGDAAGLVSPFTGEGIAAAMRSGERAAEVALDAFDRGSFSLAALAPYSRAIRSRYMGDQRAARFLRSVLRYPALLNRAFGKMRQEPGLANLFAMAYLDEQSPALLTRPGKLLRLLL